MKNKGKSTSPEKKNERRHFLSRITSLLGALAGLEFLGIGLAYFNGRRRKAQSKTSDHIFEAGNKDDYKAGSVTAFAGARFFLVRLNDGGFLALSLRCSHLGCAVNWHEKQERFICPCHASQFDKNGTVLNPPAPRALDYYPLTIEGDLVRINTARILKRSSYDKSQVVYG